MSATKLELDPVLTQAGYEAHDDGLMVILIDPRGEILEHALLDTGASIESVERILFRHAYLREKAMREYLTERLNKQWGSVSSEAGGTDAESDEVQVGWCR